MIKKFVVLVIACVMLWAVPVGAQEDLYRRISTLVVVNNVGQTVGFYVNHEFVDYVLPGEHFVYNFAVFPGEVFPVTVHVSLGERISELQYRMICYGVNPHGVVFTLNSFPTVWRSGASQKTIVVMFANETEHSLKIWYEGKYLGICNPNNVRSFRVYPGVFLIRSVRVDHSKFIIRDVRFSETIVIKDFDFWIP